ncbi:MAG TPA: autotransporter-associated beta strand repeat-containing protein [Tepidisphaeraceae bacterium]|nr:autotransporter-associated beta strand repeat-containing protein [Tepidisphaeraceae bacterium]
MNILAAAAAGGLSVSAMAASGTWITPAGGAWDSVTTANWQGGIIADGADSTADFSTLDIVPDTSVTPAAEPIITTEARTIGNLIFGDTDVTTAAGWTLAGGPLTLSTTGPVAPTITVNTLGTGKLVLSSAALNSTVGLIKSGPGMFILNNASSNIAGGITVNGGTFGVGSAFTANLAGGSSVTLSNGGGFRMHRVPSNGALLTTGNAIVLGAGGTGVISSNDSGNAYTGSISGPADAVLTVAGTGSANTAFALNQTGTKQFQSFLGKVVVADANALAFRSTSTITANGGDNTTFELQGTGNIFTRNPATIALGALTGDGILKGPTNTDGSATWVVGAKNLSTTFSGSILDNPAAVARKSALTKTGTGTLVLTNTSTVVATGLAYTGVTTVNGGVLQVDGNKWGTGAVNVNSGGTLAGSGTVAGLTTVASGGKITAGTSTTVGTLNVASLTLSAGSVINTEFGATTNDLINVTGVAANSLTINGGGFNLFNEGSASTFSTNGVYNLIQHGGAAIGGAGVGSLDVSNKTLGKTYAFGNSGTFVTLTIGDGAAASFWNSSTGGTWGAAGNWTGGIPNAAGSFAALGGGGTPIAADSTVTLDAPRTVGTLAFNSANGFTVAAGTGGSLVLDNGGTAATISNALGNHTISALVAVSTLGNSVSVQNAADSITFSGGFSGSGAINKLGDGKIVLSAPNVSYTGTISSAGGTIQIDNANALAGAGLAGNAVFGPGLSTASIGRVISGNLALTSGGSPVALTVGGANDSFSQAGGLSGTGSLIKAGTGTMTITGANTYEGGTTVNGGRISVGGTAGALGSGTVTLNNGSLGVAGAGVTNPVHVTTGTTNRVLFSGNGSIRTLTGDGVLEWSTDTSGRAPELQGNNAAYAGTIRLVSSGVDANNVPFTPVLRLAPSGTAADANVFDLSQTTFDLGNAGRLSSSINNANAQLNLGALTGQAGSTLRGYEGGSGATAKLYRIGSLNTNTTFGGTIVSGGGSSSSVAATNIAKVGTGTLALTGASTFTGTITTLSGKLLIENNVLLNGVASEVRVPGGEVQIGQHGNRVLRAGAFDVSTKLDLTDNRLIVTSAAPNSGLFDGGFYGGTAGLIQSGYNAGEWDGTGIITTRPEAKVATNGLTGIGNVSAQDAGLVGGTFGGVTVANNDLLVAYTYAGDANLDRVLDGDDYFQIDSSIGVAGGTVNWFHGDFNYDGKINGDDYFILDSNINRTHLLTFPAGGGIADAAAGGLGDVSAVPEPSSIAFLATASAALLARRRRR